MFISIVIAEIIAYTIMNKDDLKLENKIDVIHAQYPRENYIAILISSLVATFGFAIILNNKYGHLPIVSVCGVVSCAAYFFSNLLFKDIFIGVSAPNLVTAEMVSTMANDAIVFAMANPTPEIMPDVAKAGGAAIVATGRSDFPNQINNVLVFPGIFRGALDVRAKEITEEMKIAAAKAIASLVTDEELNEEYIIPSPFDKRVCPAVAKEVGRVAREQGIAKI